MKTKVLSVSGPQFDKNSLNILKKLLLENAYPPNLLNNILPSVPTTNGQNTEFGTEMNTSLPVTRYESLPYIREITPQLTELLKTLTNITISRKPP